MRASNVPQGPWTQNPWVWRHEILRHNLQWPRQSSLPRSGPPSTALGLCPLLATPAGVSPSSCWLHNYHHHNNSTLTSLFSYIPLLYFTKYTIRNLSYHHNLLRVGYIMISHSLGIFLVSKKVLLPILCLEETSMRTVQYFR